MPSMSPAEIAWYNCLEFFKRLSRINPAKLARMRSINDKIADHDREQPHLRYFEMTENTLLKHFEAVFGTKCNIFATLLYVKASK